jgi:hypothetical protein
MFCFVTAALCWMKVALQSSAAADSLESGKACSRRIFWAKASSCKAPSSSGPERFAWVKAVRRKSHALTLWSY